ncbi:MAG: lipid A export permease/ATP-binding protein MsbA [Betaproteobacteria bacterium]
MPSVLQRFARVGPYFRSGKAAIAAAGLAALVGAATEPLIPALMQPLLDKGFTGQSLPLWVIPLVIVGLFAVRGVAGFVAQYGLTWAANRAVQQMRQAMFEHLMRAEPGLFSRHSSSQLTNTLVYEVQQGATLLVGSLLTLVRDSLTLAALLIYLLWLNWQLTLFVSILFPAVAFVMRTLGRRLHKLTVAGQGATDELAYTVEENVLAWRIVRLHDAAQSQGQRFAGRSSQLRRLVMKAAIASGTMTPITQIMAAIALSCVITAALWQSSATGATVGGFVAFITAMLMLVSPIKHLSDVMAPITRGLAAIERGLDLIEHTPTEQGGTHTVERARGEIELRDVGLRYREDQEGALQGVNLHIAPGQTVALVGPSGAGKTSLVNLLPRFVAPTDGQVLLDGVPLEQWDVRALRRQFAFVSQDVVLFNDSVAANVALGADADPARVRQALEGAHLSEFVDSLPQGMNTSIGHNGGQLSGGQRQRLAIARALYKDAPLLILDEATSALDSESERAVQAALEHLMRDRTTIVIAHRLSTIEHAHRVVAMDAGRVVEQGPPADLLAAGGLYARLHAMQFRT